MAKQLKDFESRTCVKPTKALVKLAEQWDAEIDAVAKPVSAETKGKK